MGENGGIRGISPSSIPAISIRTNKLASADYSFG